jgi:hypothetical protein
MCCIRSFSTWWTNRTSSTAGTDGPRAEVRATKQVRVSLAPPATDALSPQLAVVRRPEARFAIQSSRFPALQRWCHHACHRTMPTVVREPFHESASYAIVPAPDMPCFRCRIVSLRVTSRVVYRCIIVLGLIVLGSGCASAFDALVPAHPNSLKRSQEVVCVRGLPAPADSEQITAAAVPAVIASAAIGLVGFAVDQFAKALDDEATRYKATYSGRTASHLLLVERSTSTEKVSPFVARVVVARYLGEKQCPNDLLRDSPSMAMRFIADIELADTQTVPGPAHFLTALKMIPAEFSVRFSKAKVAASGDGAIDMAVQVTLTTFVVDEKGAVRPTDVAKIDFPMGKVALPSGEAQTILTRDHLRHLESTWQPLPALKTPILGAAGKFKVGLLNISATVIESDDLGDLIAKGARGIAENRARLVEAILDVLGLRRESETNKDSVAPPRSGEKKP